MNARLRFYIALALLALLMAGPFMLTALAVYADSEAQFRQELTVLAGRWLPMGGVITLLGFILGAIWFAQLFKQYVRGLSAMAEQLDLMRNANRNFRIELTGPPEVRALAGAANALAKQRDELLTDVERQIAAAKALVEEEKNRLAALMAELSAGVLACNIDGRILLYNQRARLQFAALRDKAEGGGDLAIGLGRSIFSVLERSQITHTLDNIRHRLAKGAASPSANFVTASRGGQLLRVQMAAVLAQASSPGAVREVNGYVLIIENITREFERETERDKAMQELTDGSRASLGNLRAAAETLAADEQMPPELRARFIDIIREESQRMSQRLNETLERFAEALKTRWPLEDVLGADILAAAAKRIEERVRVPVKAEEVDSKLWVRADSFSLLTAMVFLVARLSEHYAIREVRLRLTADGAMAFVDLIWSGTPASSETLHTWELEPMNAGGETSPLTLRDVLARHGGEIWFQREKAAHRMFFRLVLPALGRQALLDEAAAGVASPAVSTSRPEYYDFNLFAARDDSIDLDRPLTDLTYTVFDTETTGLSPANGDEIIQIGAVRIVNGRLLYGEAFDQLVHPKMSLPPAGIAIHGITDERLHGQPDIFAVLPQFYVFCEGSVLVAHNAAFDMRFLQLKEASTGLKFSQPVLDTLLLSAVIHPNQDAHGLDDIITRLGLTVSRRHSALADAIVTGEVFVRLVPLLADMGITTLRAALAAAEKTWYARVKY